MTLRLNPKRGPNDIIGQRQQRIPIPERIAEFIALFLRHRPPEINLGVLLTGLGKGFRFKGFQICISEFPPGVIDPNQTDVHVEILGENFVRIFEVILGFVDLIQFKMGQAAIEV